MKKVKTDHLANELQVNASVFSKTGVNVVFQGNQAGTDGNTIVLPSLTQDMDVPERAVQVARGFVNHEAGHVAHSDIPAIVALKEECQRTGNKLLTGIHNALEDIWLERLVNDEYEGAKDTLSYTTAAVNREFLETVENMSPEEREKALSDEGYVGAVALTWEGRKDYGEETNQQCLDLLPKEIRDRLPDRIKALDACKSTQDCIALARLFDKDIREEEEKKRTPPPTSKPEGEPEEGDDDLQPEPSEDEGKDNGEKAGPDDDGNDPIPDGALSDPAPGIIETSDGSKPEEITYNPDTFDPSLSNAVEQEMMREGLMTMDEHSWRPITTDRDILHTKHNNPEMRDGKPKQYAKVVKQMGGPINAMQRKLEAGLAAQMDREWEDRRMSGRIDPRRLVGAFNCEPDVYRSRQEAPDLDTAVTILVDMSGSMSGSKIVLARDVCICLSETIYRLGAELEVLGFTTGDDLSWEIQRANRRLAREDFSRTEQLSMFVFKDFSERLSDCRAAMGGMHRHWMSMNIDGESVDVARKRLEDRPERRRVLMVLSDGYPSFYGNADGYQHLRDAVERCGDRNIDCVGIGIQSSAVERFYPRFAVCHNLDDLPTKVIGEVGKLLVAKDYRASNAELLSTSRSWRTG